VRGGSTKAVGIDPTLRFVGDSDEHWAAKNARIRSTPLGSSWTTTSTSTEALRESGVLAGRDERSDPAERGSDENWSVLERGQERQQVVDEAVERVVLCGVPVAVSVAARVARDRRPSAGCEPPRGARPRMTGLPSAVQQHDHAARRLPGGSRPGARPRLLVLEQLPARIHRRRS
jgi:hypothetical protein